MKDELQEIRAVEALSQIGFPALFIGGLRVLCANAACAELLGYDEPGELDGLRIEAFMEDVELNLVRHRLRFGIPAIDQRHCVVTKGGASVPVLMDGSTLAGGISLLVFQPIQENVPSGPDWVRQGLIARCSVPGLWIPEGAELRIVGDGSLAVTWRVPPEEANAVLSALLGPRTTHEQKERECILKAV
jgi:hypothetical protein